MALIVGELLAKLGLDDSGFRDGMNAAQGEYRKTALSAAQMARQVEQSAAKVQSARASEQAAAVRVQAAEQALNALRKSGETDTLKLAQAESRLQSALASQNSAQLRAAGAARSLSEAQRQQSRAADQAATSTQKATSATHQLSAAAQKAKGILMAAGVGFSMAAVVKGMTDAVGAARALGAQTNQMSVIFGENAGQIQSWGSTAVDTMRMSQREAQGAAIQFATFGKAMGLSGEQLVAFSKEQAKLAADLASFQGIPVADAIDAMGSAYAGQTETMRKYGVLLDENSIKQAAYANGIAEVGTKLTAQQKAQGAYYAMQQQLVHVNGDVERSNGKFGASLKTLTARLEETQASVGQKLIPVIQPFVDLLAGPGLSAVQGIAGGIGALASAFNSLPGPVQAALAAVVAFRIAQRLAGDQMALMGTRVSGLVGSFRSLGQTATVQTSMGTVAMGRFGSSIAGLGRHVPIIGRMQQSFVQAAVSANQFPRAAGAAAAAMTGMKGAASGLIGALGGPWGSAITGATVALSMWISKKQKDAAASQDAEARTRAYSDAISEAGGVIDDQVRAMVSKELADANAYEMAKKLGIGEKELTDAVLGRGKALDDIIAKTKDIDNLPKLMEGLDGDIDEKNAAVARFADSLKNAKTELTDAEKRSGELSNATEKAKVSFDSAGQATKSMSAAMEAYSEETGGAAAQVDKLAKALKGLADDKLTQEEADQSWYDGMRDLTKTLGETQAAVIGVSGAIDVTTESGSKLQDSVVSQRDAYYEVAAAAKRYTDEQQMLGKMDAGQALDYMNGKLGPLRQSFIDAAIAANYSADEAKRMADHYLGLPGEITTQLELKGADAAIAKLDAMKVKGAARIEGTYHVTDNTPEVRAKLDSLKVAYKIIDGKIVIDENGIAKARGALEELGIETESLPDGYIKIEDTSPENMARLESLGIKVQTLPNGTIVINAEDAAFWAAANRAMAPGSKPIVLEPQVNQAALAAALATIPGASAVAVATPNAAGSVRAYADGAVRRPAGVPALPSEAVIEPAGGGGLVRWAEEGAGTWESFIPGKLTARTIAILGETARRLGYGIHPIASQIRSFADGAVLSAGALKSYMRGLDGASYVWGGWGQGFNTDCSGGQSIAVNATNGNTSAGSGQRSATAGYSSWLPSQGYTLGRAPSGVPAHEIGWSPEHASGTIFDPAGGDVNFEMGGGNGGGAYGRGAVSSRDGQFPNQAWRPLGGDDGQTVPVGAPAPRTSGTGRFEEDQAPETGALGGTLIDFRDGTAHYSDGTSSDGKSWTMPAGSGSGTGSGSPVYVTGGRLDSIGGSTAPSTPTTPTTPSPGDTGGKRLFTIGGGSIYNGNPDQEPVKRQMGGTIPGTGRGDIVPLMAEPGEEVIRRDIAALPGVRAGLKQLNATGRWPEHRADGGTVGGFGGYQSPTVAKVGVLDHAPGYWLEQAYRLGSAGYGMAAMVGSAIGTDGRYQGLSTGSSTIPVLDDIAQKLDEVIKEGRVGSIGIYVGEGGQIVVDDMGGLRKTQDDAVQSAMMRSAAMR